MKMSDHDQQRLMRRGLLTQFESELARLATRAKLCIDSIQSAVTLAKYADPLEMDTEPLSIYVEDLTVHNKRAKVLREKIASLRAELGIDEK